MRSSRFTHYLVLIAVAGLLTFPNLGAPSLWDMDEGVNAECSREMLESGTWIVPTFNWELRTAKPVMLYWIQRPFIAAFGPTEWAARLPSALLGLGTVLLVYELGRRMFDPATGLLAGVVLASAVQFSMLSHASTPDAPLIFFTVLAFYLVWIGHERGGRGWFIWPAVACGCAVLSKGPVGLGLPGLVIVLYLAWNRELYRALDWKLLAGILVFFLVAGPWYGLVAAETRGEWTRTFFGKENFGRLTVPQENHSGPPFYYLAAVIVLFAPWSCVIGVTFWYTVKAAWGRVGVLSSTTPDTHGEREKLAEMRGATSVEAPAPSEDAVDAERRANRFLLCWFAVYLLVFSAAQTKLPNYIGPLYPALALLTARYLIRWSRREVVPARWIMPGAISGVALTGILVGVGFVISSGAVGPVSKGMRLFPGLETWAWVGLIPLAAAGVMAWYLWAGDRGRVVGAMAVGSVGLIGITAAGPVLVVDQYKAAKTLVLSSGAHQPDHEIRLAAVGYFQESLVFYAERKVSRGMPVEGMENGTPKTYERPFLPEDIADFLASPLPAYLFVPETMWDQQLAAKITSPVRIAARKYDFYRNEEILVVTNAPER
ncbi:ArnT family glycosyltransferase [Fimbriiglobus ruber]|uniref:Glycosyl transferase family protein n=1 Tax=Fimbriiglobus ruber TaxID=1908690 RepID=A0A225DVH9_9BACT|nr:glycosyltransferase family 39 protein [Fimbriiglobus ruber]OWK45382.1 glycosyl transferase family protein [Fimbriiglobus ruber]